MAFSLTAKHIELRGSWLVAMVQQPDGSWSFAQLDLNDHVGNNNGIFDVVMDRWYNSSRDWSCHLHGSLLCAQLKNLAGDYSPEKSINLDLFVKNRDGSLEFQDLTDSLLLYAGCLTLKDAHLRGLVVGRDGKFVPSEIDLDWYYGNINGKFEAGERHFSRSARKLRIEQDASTVKLLGELEDCEGSWHEAEIDLSEGIVNQKGKLAFLQHDETFVRQDWTPAIAENIPVLGEAISGLHAGQDREEHIYYEIASNTNSVNSTVGIAIGTFIGRAIRCPTIGMVIGARLATSPTAFVSEKIVKTIEDLEVRSQIQEAVLGQQILETLREVLTDDAAEAAAAAELIQASLNPDIDIWANGLVAWIEKQELPASVLTDLSLHTLLNKVIKQLQNEPITEWTTSLSYLTSITNTLSTLHLTPPPPPPIPEEPETEDPTPVTADEVPDETAKELPVPTVQVEDVDTKPQQESQSQTQGSQTEPEAPTTPDTTATAAVPAPPQQQQPTATSSATASTRQSSDDGKSAKSKGGSSLLGSKKGNNNGNGNGNGNGNANCANTKSWQGIFGITTFRRSWARSKQPKVVTTS